MFNLQIFAAKSSGSTSISSGHTREEGASGSSTSKQGGSQTHTESSTVGGSQTNTESHSYTQTAGNSSSISTGKTWASGKVDAATQAAYDKNNSVGYVQSDKVSAAYDALQQTLSQKPTFESKYEDKVSSLYDQIMNRGEFNYNFNEDQMYQQALDQYKATGKTAMQDTMAQAQAANGGYGSSYAQSVGQQTYQNYLREATNMINDYRDAARADWEAKGNELQNQFNLTNQLYEQEYGQYRDDVSDWSNDRTFNYGLYNDERNFDWNQYQSNRDYTAQQYWNQKNAEQSNYQASNTWYQENSQTDAYSQSNTDYWENSVTDSSTNYWENSNTSSWSNMDTYTNNYAQTLANAQAASGYTGATTSTAKTAAAEAAKKAEEARKNVENQTSGWIGNAQNGVVNNSTYNGGQITADTTSQYRDNLSSDSILLDNNKLQNYYNQLVKDHTQTNVDSLMKNNGLTEADMDYLLYLMAINGIKK